MNEKGYTVLELIITVVIITMATTIIVLIINVLDKKGQEDPTQQVVEEKDKTLPKIMVNVNGNKAIITMMDDKEISSYCISSLDDSKSCEFTKTDSATVEVVKEKGIYYAFAKDTSDNISKSFRFEITDKDDNSKIEEKKEEKDTTPPQAIVGVIKNEVTIKMMDDKGLASYCITTKNDVNTCDFINNTSSTVVLTKEAGTYYLFVVDTSGNKSQSYAFTVEKDPNHKPLVSGKNGDQVSLEGYKWHIIGQDDNKIILMMDHNQYISMNHCTMDTNVNTDCGVSGKYYQYSWDKSLIRNYLNTILLNSFTEKTKNELIATEVCKNGTTYDNNTYAYGGYTKEEIEKVGGTCTQGYTSDKIRLISVSEFHNLSSSFASATYPVKSIYDNGLGKIPRLDYITRVESKGWLVESCNDGSQFWTMGAPTTYEGPNYTKIAYYAGCGGISYYNAEKSIRVRPVIVLRK